MGRISQVFCLQLDTSKSRTVRATHLTFGVVSAVTRYVTFDFCVRTYHFTRSNLIHAGDAIVRHGELDAGAVLLGMLDRPTPSGLRRGVHPRESLACPSW